MKSDIESAGQEPLAALMTAREAGNYCGVSDRTWWRYDSSGKIPAGIRPAGGKTKRWRRRDVDLWIEMDCPDRVTFNSLKEWGKR